MSVNPDLAFDQAGNIYVTDRASGRITKFDSSGQALGTYARLGRGAGALVRAKGIALDKADRIWVVDTATVVAKIYNNAGQLLLYFGGGGEGPGDLLQIALEAILPGNEGPVDILHHVVDGYPFEGVANAGSRTHRLLEHVRSERGDPAAARLGRAGRVEQVELIVVGGLGDIAELRQQLFRVDPGVLDISGI